MKEKTVMKLASRGKRFGAACIDMAIPAVICIIFFVDSIAMALRSSPFGNGFGYNDPFSQYGYGYGYNSPMPAGVIISVIIAILLCLAYLVIQLIFFKHSKTLGKAALGMQVISSKDGKPIGFWKMLFREWFVKQASGYVLLLGYIWILIDDKNRSWHDKILDTYVIDVKESEQLSRQKARKAAPVRPVVNTPDISVKHSESEEIHSASPKLTYAADASSGSAIPEETADVAGSSVQEEPAVETETAASEETVIATEGAAETVCEEGASITEDAQVDETVIDVYEDTAQDVESTIKEYSDGKE